MAGTSSKWVKACYCVSIYFHYFTVLVKHFPISPLLFSSLGNLNHRMEQVNKWYYHCSDWLGKCRTLPLHLQTHKQIYTCQLPCLIFLLASIFLWDSPLSVQVSLLFSLSVESYEYLSHCSSQNLAIFFNYSPTLYICKFGIQLYCREYHCDG